MLGPEIGVNALHDFTKQFGFGQITGIDLEGEKRGVLPSTDWKRSAWEKERQRWYAGETISVAVGQGYNSFTLLQLAQGTSTLANDGLYRRPHLARGARSAHGPGQAHRFGARLSHPLKQANVDVIKNAMADVVRAGTARARSPTRPTRRPARPARRRCSACEARATAPAPSTSACATTPCSWASRRWSTRASPWR